jgi:hypothetical protein
LSRTHESFLWDAVTSLSEEGFLKDWQREAIITTPPQVLREQLLKYRLAQIDANLVHLLYPAGLKGDGHATSWALEELDRRIIANSLINDLSTVGKLTQARNWNARLRPSSSVD